MLDEVRPIRVESGRTSKGFPWRVTGGKGDMSSLLDVERGDERAGRHIVRLRWSPPPRTLTPGKLLRFTLVAQLQSLDKSGNFVQVKFSADLAKMGVDPGGGGDPSETLSLGESEIEEEVRVGEDCVLEKEVRVPGFGWGQSLLTGKIQLRVLLKHMGNISGYAYVYRFEHARLSPPAQAPPPAP